MRKLHLSVHPEAIELEGKSVFKRLATRAIALRGDEILLLYTRRYEDYSLPGGGLDAGEDPISGMTRELKEETGAQRISNIKAYGTYEEFRPWYKPEFDIVNMISYCYTCTVEGDLGETSYETYEINNGMRPMWMNIFEAIEHNKSTLEKSDKKGLSLERELFLLNSIVQDFCNITR